jgi:WD40 repeat protein
MRASGAEDAADDKNALIYDRSHGSDDRRNALANAPVSAGSLGHSSSWKEWRPEAGQGVFAGLSFSPSGRRLAALDPYQRETVRVWDVTTGKVIYTFSRLDKSLGIRPTDPSGQTTLISPRCFAFRTENEIDVVANTPLLRLHLDTKVVDTVDAGPDWSANHPNPSSSIPPTTVMRLAFSADGRKAAAGMAGGDIVVYESATWKPLPTLRSHSRGVTGLSFSTDGRRLVSCSGRYFAGSVVDPDERPGEIIIWDTETWKPCLTLTREKPSEYAGVGLSPDGRTLYAAVNPLETGSGRQSRGEIVRWGSDSGAD